MSRVIFMLAATGHGSMIVSRLDWQNIEDRCIGVGIEMLEHGMYAADEIRLIADVLALRRRYHGDGVVMLDCGANIGTHTVSLARHMDGWGRIIAIEAQERLYYALCGNIALNNLWNATALHSLVGDETGSALVPEPDYLLPGSYGSLEMEDRPQQDIGQVIKRVAGVHRLTIDFCEFERLDFIKLDVEGMELAALRGGDAIIRKYRPAMLIEHIKTDAFALAAWAADRGYELFPYGMSHLAIHRDDPCRPHVRTET